MNTEHLQFRNLYTTCIHTCSNTPTFFYYLRWNLSGNDGSVQSEQKYLNDDEEEKRENEKAFQTSDEMIVTTKSALTNGLYESPNHIFMYPCVKRTYYTYDCTSYIHIHTTIHSYIHMIYYNII